MTDVRVPAAGGPGRLRLQAPRTALDVQLLPAALARLTVAFRGGRDRGMAFAIFGSITGVGAAVGVLLGRFLIEHVSWRRCFFVGLLTAVIALACVWSLVSGSRAQGSTKYHWPGVVLAALGLGSLVFGFSNAEHGWDAPEAWGFIAAVTSSSCCPRCS